VVHTYTPKNHSNIRVKIKSGQKYTQNMKFRDPLYLKPREMDQILGQLDTRAFVQNIF